MRDHTNAGEYFECRFCGFLSQVTITEPTATHIGQVQVMTNKDCPDCMKMAYKVVEDARKLVEAAGFKTDKTSQRDVPFPPPPLRRDVH